jgi:hypothetical protein
LTVLVPRPVIIADASQSGVGPGPGQLKEVPIVAPEVWELKRITRERRTMTRMTASTVVGCGR